MRSVQRALWTKECMQHRAVWVLGDYGSALVGFFQKWNNGPHKRILCSTWTPQDNSLEKGIIEEQEQDPTNPTRKVMCVCACFNIRYLMETKITQTTSVTKIGLKFFRFWCSTRKFVYNVYEIMLSTREMERTKMYPQECQNRMHGLTQTAGAVVV